MKNSQKQLAELKKIAEKIAIEDFEKTTEDHQFSEAYQSKKAAFLGEITKVSKPKKSLKKQLAVAAAVLLIGVPTTVFAGTKLYEMIVKKEKYEVKLSVKNNNQTADSKQFYRLELGYLPPKMIGNEESHKYSYEDNLGRGGLSLILWKINDQAEFSTLNIGDYREVTYGERQGVVATTVDKGAEGAFDRHVYLMFPEEGYLLETYVGSDVPEAELVKVMKEIKLTPTTKKQASHFLDYDDYQKERSEEPANRESQVKGIPVASPRLAKIGQAISPNDSRFTYQIDKVEVLDSISEIEQSNLSDFALERMTEDGMLDQEGNLVPFERKTYTIGDGKTSIDKEFSHKQVKPKFVYLTTTLISKSEEPIEDLYYQHPIQLLVKNGQEWTYEQTETYDAPSALSTEVDYLDSHGEDNSYYRLPVIQPKEKRTIHVGYFVDEDQLDKMFLNIFYYGGSSQVENEDGSMSEVNDLGAADRWWIDIRQLDH